MTLYNKQTLLIGVC